MRGADVFVVQPTCSPVNDHVMELLILLDAFRRSSASRITAVMPYFGYARQDKKDKPRVPIAAKLMADLLTASGADRILTMDLHAAQIQGFFNIPVDHLFAAPVLLDAIRELDARRPRHRLARRRGRGPGPRHRQAARTPRSPSSTSGAPGKNETEVLNVVGDVEGKNVLILDDIIDTAGTLVQAEEALRRAGGAADLRRGRPPGLLRARPSSGSRPPELETLLVTNTIPLDAAMARCPQIRSLPSPRSWGRRSSASTRGLPFPPFLCRMLRRLCRAALRRAGKNHENHRIHRREALDDRERTRPGATRAGGKDPGRRVRGREAHGPDHRGPQGPDRRLPRGARERTRSSS